MLISFFFIITAYLLGSISSAILFSKLFRLPDPRLHGSNNAGATNVLRLGGKIPALLTLIGDIAKGVLPVLFGKWWGVSDMVLASILIAAFLGHLYPIYFHFQGGKGVATALGGIMSLDYFTGGTLTLIWLITAIFFRFSSLASITASMAAPLILFLHLHNFILSTAVFFMSVILIFKHRENIQRLYLGTEPKIGKKTAK